MRNVVPRTLRIVLALSLVALFAAGCARKSKEAPPTLPPTPPVVQPETPTVPPTPSTPSSPTSTDETSSRFSPAFFDYDSYALRDDARAALDKDAKILRDDPGVAITVEGHCDERGTVEYNQALGEKRANVARDYLVAAGIAASRVRTLSYGKERPFSEGHDESAWAQNRRAHLVAR